MNQIQGNAVKTAKKLERENPPDYQGHVPPEILRQREDIQIVHGYKQMVAFAPTTGEETIWDSSDIFTEIDAEFMHIAASGKAREARRVIIGEWKRDALLSQVLCAAKNFPHRIMGDQSPVVSFCRKYIDSFEVGRKLVFPVYGVNRHEVYFVVTEWLENGISAKHVSFFDQTLYKQKEQQIVLLYL